MPRFRPPTPPRPELWRRPNESFGWLEARLLHDGILARLGTDGVAVLVLLALAADARGVSFYARSRMAERLGLSREHVDEGLRRLESLDLVAFRPWQFGSLEGVWQLLPLPRKSADTAASAPLTQPLRARSPESRGS